VFGRSKRKRLIHAHLARIGFSPYWYEAAEAAVYRCEAGDHLEPLLTGAGPCPARSIVSMLELEPLVEGDVDWSLHDELTEPGGWFYPPNNDMALHNSRGRALMQEWFFPGGDEMIGRQRIGVADADP
jgi:hypothetical protein